LTIETSRLRLQKMIALGICSMSISRSTATRRSMALIGPGRGTGHLDLDWLPQELVGETAHLLRHGGREKHGLAALQEKLEDPLDIGNEAHVEHPVRLVDDEHLDARHQDLAAVEPVEQAAGRGDQDIDTLLEQLLLVTHADAADEQRHGEVEMLAVGLEAVGNLRRQLARRAEDQRARHPGAGAAGGEAVQHRQGEARRLAGAGLRDADDVAALEQHGDGAGLDRGGVHIAGIGDGTLNLLAQAKLGEGDGR
jgi:hypothetical protein